MPTYPNISCTIKDPFGKDLEVRDFHRDLAYYKANVNDPCLYPLSGMTYGEVYEGYIMQLESYGMERREMQLKIISDLLHEIYNIPSQFGCILVELKEIQGKERLGVQYHLHSVIDWLETHSPFLGFLSDDYLGVDRITDLGIIPSNGLLISRYAYLLSQISEHVRGKGEMTLEMWETVIRGCEYLAAMEWYRVTLQHKVSEIEFTPIRKKIGDHFFRPQKIEGKLYWVIDQEGKDSVKELVD